MSDLCLNLNHIEPLSLVNGPGRRAVVWVQGCTLNCPSCFNPLTHPPSAGKQWPVYHLVKWIEKKAKNVEGITISGGEPLQQIQPLTQLTLRVKEISNLSILLFSGFTWEEIRSIPGSGVLLASIDVLIAGRYLQSKRLASGLIGSANKTVHFLTNRYTIADLAPVPNAEVILDRSGNVVLSGIDPLRW